MSAAPVPVAPVTPPAPASAPPWQPVSSSVWRAELRYRTLVEQIPVVTFMAALDENIHELYVSPQIETLLGFTQAEWLDNPFLWYSQLHPDDRDRWSAEFANTCATGVQFRSDFRFIARDGHIVWVHGECRVIRDPQGRPLFFQGIAYDISDLKRAEEMLRRMRDDLDTLVNQRTQELEQANQRLRQEIAQRQRLEQDLRERAEQLRNESRRKDHFLAVLSHELRNPLSAIAMALDMQARGDPQDREMSQAIVQRQFRQMRSLIDELLDISRITHGKINLRRSPLDWNTVVRSAIESVRPLLDEQHHALEVDLSSEPLSLLADAVRLEQIVVNLLTNAAKYTPRGGRIVLTTRREGAHAVLRLQDNGIGIPSDMLSSIFELFAQVDRSESRTKQWGMGVGLALVRGLVELHGGTVTAYSQGADRGSEFVVRLPLAAPAADAGDRADLPGQKRPAASETPVAADPRESGVRASRRVLVIDDHADSARLLSRLLASHGHSVTTAGDAVSGITKAREVQPHVVLLDIGLPEMDGYDAVRALRGEPAASAACIIAITGYGRDEDRKRALEAGFDAHLTKPVDFERLLSIVDGKSI